MVVSRESPTLINNQNLITMKKFRKTVLEVIIPGLLLLIGTVLLYYGQLSCEYTVSEIGAVLLALSSAPLLLTSIIEDKRNNK